MGLLDLDLERLRARRSIKWSHYGPDCLPAWVAEMDFPVAEPIREVLSEALEHDDFGYPQSSHALGLEALLAERMQRRYGWELDPARVEVLNDVVQGLWIALLAFSAPGDGVVVQTPIYPPFLDSVCKAGRRLLLSPLVAAADRYEIDFDHLREVSQGARLLLLCHPHNPTGRVFTRGELERLGGLALELDLCVVSDEIHADLTFPGQNFLPFASLGPELAERTVTLTSASKAFNIAGLRCAFAHFGSAELQARFNACVPQHARGGVGILGQHCTLAAWRGGDSWLDEVKLTLDSNRRFVVNALERLAPRLAVRLPEATYLAWLDCQGLGLPLSPARHFLEQAGVALSDGKAFGPGFEQCARLNFGTSPALLAEIVRRVVAAVV
jgi:cysteine-S-conjugate beta-lyase